MLAACNGIAPLHLKLEQSIPMVDIYLPWALRYSAPHG